MRSSRILNPMPDKVGASVRATDVRIAKKPLIGSVRSAFSTRRDRRVAIADFFTRSSCHSPRPPPSTKREPTTTSIIGSRCNESSIAGRIVSSCCRSPSITATIGAAVAHIPSMQAVDSPRRPIRWITRTRASSRPSARAASAVPSGLSSSTKIASQRRPASAWSSLPIRTATFARSLKVGMTMAISSRSGVTGGPAPHPP